MNIGTKLKRRGAAIVAVVATLLVTTMLLAGVCHTMFLVHHSTTVGEHERQAYWLSEAAASRARRALAKSADYRGETWRIAPAQWPAAKAASATINVEKPADDRPRQLKVTVRYTVDDGAPLTLTRTLPLPNAPASKTLR